MAKRILSISHNPRLLIARNDMLAVAGYSVSSPRHPGDAVQLFRQNSYDVIIIGHSVTSAERNQILDALERLGPRVPVIFAAPQGEPAEPRADAIVDIADPDSLMQALARLLV